MTGAVMTNQVDDTIKAMGDVLNLIKRVREEHPDAPAQKIAEAVVVTYDSKIEELLEQLAQLQSQYEELQKHKSVMVAMSDIVKSPKQKSMRERFRVAAE